MYALRGFPFTFISSNFPARMCSKKLSVRVKERIELSESEKKILDNLNAVVRHFNLPTQLRIAGGWVRDKLLGLECHDIDIVLDDMMGREFCEKVEEYLLHKGEEIRGSCVINCNPDQSKHLETARMHVFDEWIDFVNLRSEDYSDNSRIPTMRFGTPEEDAFRRDLTINSLFYNIRTDSVEDFTGRGIQDLKNGKIVTPLPAKQTFLDDPLRILRAIRFGSRFNFELDEEIKTAAAENNIKAALANKISRERIGIEIDKMMSDNQPVKALAYISELQLFWSVFSLPPEMQPSKPKECERNCVDYMDSAWRLFQSLGSSFATDGQRHAFLYAALLLPFYKDMKWKVVKNKKIPSPSVNYIISTCLKLSKNVAQDVTALHVTADKFLSLIPALLKSDEDLQAVEVEWKREVIDVPVTSKLRILCGIVMQEIKESWRTALVVSLLQYPCHVKKRQYPCTGSSENDELMERKELVEIVEKRILRMGLDKVWEVKALVSGDVIKRFIKEGPLIREWKEKLMQWQLSYPSGSESECLDWMMKNLVPNHPTSHG